MGSAVKVIPQIRSTLLDRKKLKDKAQCSEHAAVHVINEMTYILSCVIPS